jgi:ribose 5-phosphate isomerase B
VLDGRDLLMRIVFATDERTPVSTHIVERLRDGGHAVDVVGDGDPWPDAGHRVGIAVAEGQADRGIVCCWTGTGVSIAANHVSPEVRAALCVDAETARGARRWNDANVLALSLRLTTEAVADEIVDAFLTTEPEEAERANFERA